MKKNNKKLGEKISSTYYTGELSIKGYEQGIELKLYNQPRIAMTYKEAETMLKHVQRVVEKQKVLEEL